MTWQWFSNMAQMINNLKIVSFVTNYLHFHYCFHLSRCIDIKKKCFSLRHAPNCWFSRHYLLVIFDKILEELKTLQWYMMWARPDRHDIQIKNDKGQIILIHILLHQNLFVSPPTSRYADFHAIRCWFDKVLQSYMYDYDVLIMPLKENVWVSVQWWNGSSYQLLSDSVRSDSFYHTSVKNSTILFSLGLKRLREINFSKCQCDINILNAICTDGPPVCHSITPERMNSCGFNLALG